MLDYMDDTTAITYLSTCHSLHAGYHQYPLKAAMSVTTFLEATQLERYFKRMQTWKSACIQIPLANLFSIGFLLPRTGTIIFNVVVGTVLVLSWCYFLWLLLMQRRVDCCAKGRLGMWRRHYCIPRVMKLREGMSDMRLLPYLQHLTELATLNNKYWPIGRKHPLPHSLRTLQLYSSADLTLKQRHTAASSHVTDARRCEKHAVTGRYAA